MAYVDIPQIGVYLPVQHGTEADETICTDCDELMNFLTEKNHPVLGMEPLM